MSERETTPHDAAPHLRDNASTDALPVAPALGASLDAARMPRRSTLVEPRILFIAALAIVLGVAAALVA
ncbi:MAG: chloride channel protein, partial [Lysobacter sp.]